MASPVEQVATSGVLDVLFIVSSLYQQESHFLISLTRSTWEDERLWATLIERPYGAKGRTRLLLAAKQGSVRVVKRLLQMKANIEAEDVDKERALSHACFAGNAQVVALLLTKGCAKIAGVRDARFAWTPLHNAAFSGSAEVCKLLLEAVAATGGASGDDGGGEGARLVNIRNGKGSVPLLVAAQEGHSAVIDMLCTTYEADINACNTLGWSSLHVAARFGRFKAVRLLLQRGANINALTNSPQQRSALYFACFFAQEDVVRELLSQGARTTVGTNLFLGATLNIHDNDRKELQMAGFWARRVMIVRELIKYKVPVLGITNAQNRSPVDLARINKQSDICRDLEKYISSSILVLP